MTPKRIILLRHGESAANVDSKVYAEMPDWRIALTENGVRQAREAGGKIAELLQGESFGVFCSPYCRTIQTKDAMLAGVGVAPKFETLLQLPNCYVAVMTCLKGKYMLEEPFSRINVFTED